MSAPLSIFEEKAPTSLGTHLRRLYERAIGYKYAPNPKEAAPIDEYLKTAKNERSFLGTAQAEDKSVILWQRPDVRKAFNFPAMLGHINQEGIPQHSVVQGPFLSLPERAVTTLANTTNGVVQDAAAKCRTDILIMKKQGFDAELYLRLDEGNSNVHAHDLDCRRGETVISALAGERIVLPSPHDVRPGANPQLAEILPLLLIASLMEAQSGQALSGRLPNFMSGIVVISPNFERATVEKGAKVFRPELCDMVRVANEPHKKAPATWHGQGGGERQTLYLQGHGR